ncbi:MAG: biotin/lipoyl-binding protein [Oxalobacteraceae bacterium]|nr:biotin/lipoyl-binding protein [Oxalobacteraceae bacterium]
MRTRNIVFIIILVVVAVFGARFWFNAKAPANPAPPSPAAVKTNVPTALEFLASEVVTTEPSELRQLMQMTGTLRAVDQVTVKAKVAAEVRAVMVREGESVKAGQVLVKLDASEYEARVKSRPRHETIISRWLTRALSRRTHSITRPANMLLPKPVSMRHRAHWILC